MNTEIISNSASPSQKLVERLSKRVYAPEWRLRRLVGRYVGVSFMENEMEVEFIGRVTALTNRRLVFLAERKHTYHPDRELVENIAEEQREANAYFIDQSVTYSKVPPWEKGKKITYLPVHQDLPTVIAVVYKDIEALSFHKHDPDLDDLINQWVRERSNESPPAKMLKEVASWVYEHIPYRLPEESESRRSALTSPLGYEVRNINAVCKSLAGVAMAILELGGIQCQPVVIPPSNHRDGHLFLKVKLEGTSNIRIVDPTWNLVGSTREAYKELTSRGLPLDYHRYSLQRQASLLPSW